MLKSSSFLTWTIFRASRSDKVLILKFTSLVFRAITNDTFHCLRNLFVRTRSLTSSHFQDGISFLQFGFLALSVETWSCDIMVLLTIPSTTVLSTFSHWITFCAHSDGTFMLSHSSKLILKSGEVTVHLPF